MTVTNDAIMGFTPSSSSGISSFQTITALATSDTIAPQPITPPNPMSSSARSATIPASAVMR